MAHERQFDHNFASLDEQYALNSFGAAEREVQELEDGVDDVNDETFGGDLGSMGTDLQTASLRLDDCDGPAFPGTQSAAPDASQNLADLWRNVGSTNTPSLFGTSIWSQQASAEPASSKSKPFSQADSSAFTNFSSQLQNALNADQSNFGSIDKAPWSMPRTPSPLATSQQQQQPINLASLYNLPVLERATRLEDIEQDVIAQSGALASQSSTVVPQSGTLFPQSEMIVQQSTPIYPQTHTVAQCDISSYPDPYECRTTPTILDRVNEDKLNMRQPSRKPIKMNVARRIPTPNNLIAGPPAAVPPNVMVPPVTNLAEFMRAIAGTGMPPLPFEWLEFVAIWVECIAGRVMYLPPNVPPPPPQFVAVVRNMAVRLSAPSRGNAMPPPGMIHPRPLIPPPYNDSAQRQQQTNDYTMRKMTRRYMPGMPSGKTIGDLALDPFAGFMSCKEREWLVKIQLMQCTVNNPFEEDFYYTVWREKQLAAGWQPTPKKEPEQIEREREERCRRYRERRDTERAHSVMNREDRKERNDDEKRERVPFFAGSLGRPIKSTVYNPRNIITVNTNDGSDTESKPDDDDDSDESSAHNQRAMLLRLEAAASLLLSIEDQRRLVSHQPIQAVENASYRIFEGIYRQLFHDSAIVQTLEGRHLFAKFLRIAPPQIRPALIINFFNVLSEFQSKQYSDISAEMCPIIHEFLSGIDCNGQLSLLITGTNFDVLAAQIQNFNTLARDLLCTLLLTFERIGTGPPRLIEFLQLFPYSWDRSKWHRSLSAWANSLSLTPDALSNLILWLRLNAPSTSLIVALSGVSLYPRHK